MKKEIKVKTENGKEMKIKHENQKVIFEMDAPEDFSIENIEKLNPVELDSFCGSCKGAFSGAGSFLS